MELGFSISVGDKIESHEEHRDTMTAQSVLKPNGNAI
jgi:hypothetical protein